MIHQLAEAHKTVVLISHDIDEILEHCTSLTVLRDGEDYGGTDQRRYAEVRYCQ